MRKGDLSFAIGAILLAAGCGWTATSWPFRSALFPMFASISLFVSCSVYLALNLFRTAHAREPADVGTSRVSSAATHEVADGEHRMREELIAAVVLPLAVMLLIWLLGFAIGGAIGVALYMWLADRGSWWSPIVGGGVTLVIVGYLLNHVMEASLFPGVIELGSFGWIS